MSKIIQKTLYDKEIEITNYNVRTFFEIRNIHFLANKMYKSEDEYNIFFKNREIAIINQKTLDKDRDLKINIGEYKGNYIINGVLMKFDLIKITNYMIRFTLDDESYEYTYLPIKKIYNYIGDLSGN